MPLRRPASWEGAWPPVSRPPEGWTAERWKTQMDWSVLGIPPPGWKPPRATRGVREVKQGDRDQLTIPGLQSSKIVDRGGQHGRGPDVSGLRRGDRAGIAPGAGVPDQPDVGVPRQDEGPTGPAVHRDAGPVRGDVRGAPPSPPGQLSHNGLPGWWRNLGLPVYCRACGERLTVGAPAGKGAIAWRTAEVRPRGTWLCLSRDDTPHDPIELEG